MEAGGPSVAAMLRANVIIKGWPPAGRRSLPPCNFQLTSCDVMQFLHKKGESPSRKFERTSKNNIFGVAVAPIALSLIMPLFTVTHKSEYVLVLRFVEMVFLCIASTEEDL